jgi:hypothetical protein
MAPCKTPSKERADRNFFFGSTTYLTGPTGRCLGNHLCPCKFGLPTRSIFTNLHALQIVCLPRSQSQSQKNILRSSFVRYPTNPFGDPLHYLSPHPPTQPHRMERICFSAALQSSSLRLVYIITTQFFVLRSAFSLESQKDPYHSCPPMSVCVARARMALWSGFIQSGSLDCSVFFQPVLYCSLITGNSVYY